MDHNEILLQHENVEMAVADEVAPNPGLMA